MLKLDNNLLDELGLGGLPEDQKRGMLQHIYETLELRVGTDLANQMTDQQLEEFEKFIDEGGDANQAQALQWLEANLPHYKEVVNRVFEELKAEIRNMAPQIMASSVPAGGSAPAAPQMAQPYVPPVTPAGPMSPGPQPVQANPYQPAPMPGPAPAPMGPAAFPGPAPVGPGGYQQPPMQPTYGSPQPMPQTTYQPDPMAMPATATQPDPLAGSVADPQSPSGSPYPMQQPPAGPGYPPPQYPPPQYPPAQ
ncbi:MAG TPA: DUF5663 domain-containing protein [Candidatus Saccharimonadales bacterium]|nr:DUF5663 domain-containing protein [Candidatus Saccharimonadales bacterium]